MKRKGHVIFDLCMPSGNLTRTTFSKSNIQPVPSLYKALRKAAWGGLFPVGAGDEESHSILTKRRQGLHHGLKPKPTTAIVDPNDARANDKGILGKGTVVSVDRGRFQPKAESKPKKTITFADFQEESEGVEVPLHSTYRRSNEFLTKDIRELQEAQLKMEKEVKVDHRKKSLSKMGAAFRARREARKTEEETNEENNPDQAS